MQYLAYEQSGQHANIIVDGVANCGTELTLSHWPGNLTPQALKADLSAEIVFNYLAQPDFHTTAQVVSNNHFDADGLIGIYALLNPEEAFSLKDLLLDVAGAGDFEIYKDRDAARLSFVLDAWNNPRTSPLKASIFKESHATLTNVLYEEILPRFEKMIEKINSLEKFWKQQDDLLDASEEAFGRGLFRLEECPHLDLAIVMMPDANQPPAKAIHRMAIHNLTKCMRVLLMQETNFELYYRYETWVDYQSHKTVPRLDLQELAESLSKQESMDGKWSFSGINELTPALRLTGDSTSKIPFDIFRSQVLAYLTRSQSEIPI
ncbi:MAG TPA: DUF6687 family protein [Drouetiella sp.]